MVPWLLPPRSPRKKSLHQQTIITTMAMNLEKDSSTAGTIWMGDRGRGAAHSVSSLSCESQERVVAAGLSLGNATVALEQINIVNSSSDLAVKSEEGRMIPQAIASQDEPNDEGGITCPFELAFQRFLNTIT